MTNMGIKKLSEASMKISKKQDDKKQLNSLIKVLRPKVYITDPSSFKSLVQELTGNGNIYPVSSPPPVDETSSPIVEYFQEDDDRDRVFQEPTADSSPQFSVPITSPEQSPPEISSDDLLHHDCEITEFSALRDLESWLLEIDNFPYCDGYSPFAHQ